MDECSERATVLHVEELHVGFTVTRKEPAADRSDIAGNWRAEALVRMSMVASHAASDVSATIADSTLALNTLLCYDRSLWLPRLCSWN